MPEFQKLYELHWSHINPFQVEGYAHNFLQRNSTNIRTISCFGRWTKPTLHCRPEQIANVTSQPCNAHRHEKERIRLLFCNKVFIHCLRLRCSNFPFFFFTDIHSLFEESDKRYFPPFTIPRFVGFSFFHGYLIAIALACISHFSKGWNLWRIVISETRWWTFFSIIFLHNNV